MEEQAVMKINQFAGLGYRKRRLDWKLTKNIRHSFMWHVVIPEGSIR